MFFPPNSKSHVDYRLQSGHTEKGNQICVSKFAFGSLRKVAKSIPGNLVFLRFHGGLRICLNNLEKSHCDVCTYKELQGYKTGKLQVHKLH